jgi:hypothetical protein
MKPRQTIPRQVIDVCVPQTIGPRLFIGSGPLDRLCGTTNPPWRDVSSDEFKRNRFPAAWLPQIKLRTSRRISGAAGLILCGVNRSGNRISGGQTRGSGAFRGGRKQAMPCLRRPPAWTGLSDLSGKRLRNPEQGALPALVKTAAREWEPRSSAGPSTCLRIFPTRIGRKAIVAELLTIHDHDPVEIGLSPDRRVIVEAGSRRNR